MRRLWQRWQSEKGSQVVEYLGLGVMVVALIGLFVAAVRGNGTLGSKVTAAVANFIDAVTGLLASK